MNIVMNYEKDLSLYPLCYTGQQSSCVGHLTHLNNI